MTLRTAPFSAGADSEPDSGASDGSICGRDFEKARVMAGKAAVWSPVRIPSGLRGKLV